MVTTVLKANINSNKATVPESSSIQESQSQVPSDGVCLQRLQTSFSGTEKFDAPVIQERLGTFDRCSLLTFWLIFICCLLGISCYLLTQILLNDEEWTTIIKGKMRFPNASRTKVYFENTYINETELGRAIKRRSSWVKGGMNFGLDRPTLFDWITNGLLLAILAICVIHLLLVCVLDVIRSSFSLISLGYGFIGLFTFSLCLVTMYHGFVHQTSCYLENAKIPPDIKSPTVKQQFINLNMACAFAFARPNRFIKYSANLRPDASFVINGTKYDKFDLIELGLCPKQDLLLIAMSMMFLTSVTSWLVASYSEKVENEIQGPPVWLSRFKLKKSGRVRKWHQRKLGASTSPISMRSSKVDALFSSVSFDDQRKWLEKRSPQGQVIEDAYCVLDGGTDHIILKEPIIDLAKSASAVRYYDKYFSARHK